MKEFVTTLTERGQITVPAEVRRLLGVGPRDKLAFRIEGDDVRLAPVSFPLETAYLSVPPLAQPLDDAEMMRIAREDRAERLRCWTI
ncbi:MAG: AbrB/MazE/SpoVT family DNA-binding domain-containing protein [Dehalococcoidia bacterium]